MQCEKEQRWTQSLSGSPYKYMILLNAFSLQMVDGDCIAKITEVKSLPQGLVSAVGHADTAKVLGVEMNRLNIVLKEGDTAYIAQLVGGRLPEGATTLPEGFKFVFKKVEILPLSALND